MSHLARQIDASPAKGEADKVDGLFLASLNAGKDFRGTIRYVIHRLAFLGEGKGFTSDDVLETFFASFPYVSSMPSHPNALGAAMAAASKAGIIRASGRVVKSRRPSAHARLIQVWLPGPNAA